MPQYLPLDMFPASPEYPEGQQRTVLDALKGLIRNRRRTAPSAPLMFAICAPCQSFTKFIQRHMTRDRAKNRERDQNLLSQTVRFIEEFRPEMVVSENVASIDSGKYRHIWGDFRSELHRLGYNTGAGKVCASQFGVPQRRRRSVIIAFRNYDDGSVDFDLPIPSGDLNSERLSVEKAIGHLPELQAGERAESVPNHMCRNVTELNRQRLMSVEPGEPNFGFSQTEFGDLSLPCHRRLADKGKRGFGDVYTRMRPDRPSPTITTRFHSVSNGRFGHYDKTQVRGLSLREGAALQSFDDGYEFYGEGMDSIAKMIGNAVPPKLSAYMAKWLLGLWKESIGSTSAEKGA